MEKESTKENEKSGKFQSRKFIVWIAATIFEMGAIALAFIKDTSLASQFTPWWGAISTVYIGGNVVQKFAEIKTPSLSEESSETECGDEK